MESFTNSLFSENIDSNCTINWIRPLSKGWWHVLTVCSNLIDRFTTCLFKGAMGIEFFLGGGLKYFPTYFRNLQRVTQLEYTKN